MDFFESLLKPEIMWLIAGVILLLAEFALPGLIIGFFGAGAILVGLLQLVLPLSFNLQIVLFIVFSLVMLLTLRKWLSRVFIGRSSESQEGDSADDDFVGETAIVIETIKADRPGKVELHGTTWQAAADEDIKKDARVEVVGKSSITLKVKSL